MSIALKGLITGLATGIGEAIDEERKETKQRIAARTKNAYENYIKHQEQVSALKSEIQKRDAEALQFQDPANPFTDDERIAIATMPNAVDLYKRAVADGRTIDGRKITLRDVISVGEKAKGMKYDDFVNALGKVEPAQQMMFEPKTSFFGTSPEKQRRLMETMAGTVGVPAEQLMAFERPREVPRVEPMGALNIENLFKREKEAKTANQRLDEYKVDYIDAIERYGKDSPQAEVARLAAVDLAASIKSLDPEQEKFSDMLDRAKIKAAKATPGTPEHKQAIAEVDRLVAIGKQPDTDKLPSISQMRGLFSDTVTRSITSKFGNLVGKDIAIETSIDGTSTYRYIGTDAETKQKIREEEIRALSRQYRKLSDSAGRPLNADVERMLISYGIEFDRNGIPIFSSAAPKPAPAAGAASPVGASRVTPGAAAPTTRPAAPTVAPAAGSAQPAPVTPQPVAQPRIDIAAERKSANDAIAGGANREAVAKRFKERTGQNL